MSIDVDDLLGVPYVMGGRGPEEFDCWGLVVECGRRLGKRFPDWDGTDWKDYRSHAKRFMDEKRKKEWEMIYDLRTLQPGDIGIARAQSGRAHAGLYLDNNMVIHSDERCGVRIDMISKFTNEYVRVSWARHL